jgi:hypothetical protein
MWRDHVGVVDAPGIAPEWTDEPIWTGQLLLTARVGGTEPRGWTSEPPWRSCVWC